MKANLPILGILAIVLAAALPPLAAGTPSITAEIDPAEISLGQSALLVVSLKDGQAAARPQVPHVPHVDGLNFDPAGQSSQIRIVNGEMSSGVRYTHRVTAHRTGEYDIPAIAARVNGETLHTKPLKLRVVASNAGASPARGKPHGAIGSTPAAADLSERVAFLRLELLSGDSGRDHLFVGEMTPVALRAYFREGARVSLTAKPSLAGAAYTLHGLSDEPEQQMTTIDGQRFRFLTWYAGLSGAKAGQHPVEVTMEATVGIPRSSGRAGARSPLRSPFGAAPFYSLFDDFFAPVEEREVSLTSPMMPITVKPLPLDGRPAHFKGAVGQFEVGSFNIPAEMHAGDPANLSVTITGKGNFDRVASPQLLPAEGWKIYGVKERLSPADSVGFAARKTFAMPVIALEPGRREVGFSFAFFDPDAGEYRTADSEPVPVHVTGTAVAVKDLMEPNSTRAATAASEVADPAIAPLRVEPGRIIDNPAPLYRRSWFLALQTLPAAALVAALAMAAVRRHRERNPDALRRRTTAKAIDEQLRRAESARLRRDGTGFFAAARRALQLRLADRWGCNPDAITAEEIDQRLPRGCSSARVFAMADTAEFSGARPCGDSLDDWQDRLVTALAELDQNSTSSTSQAVSRHWGETAHSA